MKGKAFQVTVLIAAVSAISFWFLSGTSGLKGPDAYRSATVLDVPVPLPEFSLTGNNGKQFGLSDLGRKWTFMFFGYTHCPDVCPTALVDLNHIYHDLSGRGDLGNTQVVFVSVDPERDTAEVLNEYIPFFNENFIGITGDPGSVRALSRPLGVSYWRTRGGSSESDYLIDHSASFLLIDPLGRMRAVFTPPHDPGIIAEDFRVIRRTYAEECCVTTDDGLDDRGL